LPFVDYQSYLDISGMHSDPPAFSLIDPKQLPALAAAAGLTQKAYVAGQLEDLEDDLEERRRHAASNRDRADSVYEREIYADLCDALDEDLKEIQKGDGGSLTDRVTLYNRVAHEEQLEVKYNLNLTSNDAPKTRATWSEEELQALDEELSKLPVGFTLFDYQLREIQRKVLLDGSGGVNYGGLIALPEGAGAVRHAMIHEIGHDFADDNPKWNEFLALSGWKDVSEQFSDISGDDKKDPATGQLHYAPYDGDARLNRDGKIYSDGEVIDLDGDGRDDGVVQVHYGKVMVCDQDARFVSDYAHTNPGDDFAECFKAFFRNPETLKAADPGKYEFMVDFTGQDPLADAA
jgi:hypothetical protein